VKPGWRRLARCDQQEALVRENCRHDEHAAAPNAGRQIETGRTRSPVPHTSQHAGIPDSDRQVLAERRRDADDGTFFEKAEQ